MKAWLLDVNYVHAKKAIRLLLKINGKSIRAYHKHEPYFYLKPKAQGQDNTNGENGKADAFASTIEQLKKIQAYDGEKNYNLERIEPVERLLEGKKTTVLKLVVAHPGLVPKFQDLVRHFGETYEYNILFTRRYLIDRQLTPSSPVDVEFEQKNGLRWVTSIQSIPSEEMPPANVLAFDIETYNPHGMPDPKRDPMIMLSYADAQENKVVTYAQPPRTESFVQNVATEKDVLERFAQVLREKHTDILCTYNGDVFDLPYVTERSFQTRAATHFGRDHAPAKSKRLGMRNVTSLGGRIHFDVYNTVFFLNYIGATKLQRMTQLSAYEGLLGKTKADFPKDQIVAAWDNKGQPLTDLIEYSRQDAVAAYELAQYCLPLFYALGKVTGTTLFDASRFSSGQLVEALLLKKAFDRGEISPNKPTAEEVAARTAEPIQGAYVKLPQAGVYENMAVYDFKSLYPSIIISHNIDPSTLDCDCCRGVGEAHVSPMGHRFCKKRVGLIPAMLQEVLTTRFALQKQMKNLNTDSAEYKQLYGKQWALKILANSTYGVLLYPRFRWFRRECGESVTAYGRQYIQDTIAKAEKEGFGTLYGDSLTSDRFVTLQDEKGQVQIKNVEELFNDYAARMQTRGKKEIVFPKGVRALSVHPDTLETSWKPVNEVIRHKTDKPIVRVRQKFGETIVTTDHSLMTKQGNRLVEAKPEQMKAQPMYKVNEIPAVQPYDHLDVYSVVKGYAHEAVYKGRKVRSVARADDAHVYFNWTQRKKPVKVRRFIDLNTTAGESLCRLLAAYIAEGSSSTPETTSSRWGASIASSDVSWLEQLQYDYNQLFGNVRTCIVRATHGTRELTYSNDGMAYKTIHYVDNTHKLQMMNQLSAVFFKRFCGQKSTGKKLPDFIYHASRDLQELFLEQLIKGDGSHSVNKKLGYSKKYIEKNFSYTTRSLQLISGLTFLLTQMGRTYSIQYRASKKAYTLKTSDKHNERLNTKITPERYEGYVYDLSVEGTHTFVDSCGQILLHNTDSIFLQYNGKTKEDVLQFAKTVNATLPESMQLELEDFYPRGIFVSKKQGETGAKKKYALINEDGKIKIRGFELVRRDWSKVARNTQRSVLEILLKEGDVKKAADLVRTVVTDLKEGKTPLEDCVIYTQLKKKVANYEIKSPEVGAVIHARKNGVNVPEGATVAYVITTDGGGGASEAITEKARIVELAKNYDPEYYINNQVLPAVLKILGSLGYDKDSIKIKGTQKGLGDW